MRLGEQALHAAPLARRLPGEGIGASQPRIDDGRADLAICGASDRRVEDAEKQRQPPVLKGAGPQLSGWFSHGETGKYPARGIARGRLQRVGGRRQKDRQPRMRVGDWKPQTEPDAAVIGHDLAVAIPQELGEIWATEDRRSAHQVARRGERDHL